MGQKNPWNNCNELANTMYQLQHKYTQQQIATQQQIIVAYIEVKSNELWSKMTDEMLQQMKRQMKRQNYEGSHHTEQ